MREIAEQLEGWRAAGHAVALARVVDVEGSAPRDAGAAMAVDDRGEVVGSVAGGCVEGAVVEVARELLAGDRAPGVVTFGYSDDDAFAVGLTCGGTVRLLVTPLTDAHVAAARALRAEIPAALATVTRGPRVGADLLVIDDATPVGSLGSPGLDNAVTRDLRGALDTAVAGIRHYGPDGQARADDVEVFLEPFAPRPVMIIFGAVDFSAALTRVAKQLGYHVVVCDAREVFATPARFPMADEVVVDWPDRYLESRGANLGPRDAVCVLTHDAKFDVPALRAALATEVGYLGAMGSRRTDEHRRARLREAGVDERDLVRLHAPIGLDLGARTPEEVAVAICAEIIAVRSGRSGVPLRDTDGPIHDRAPATPPG